jgi:TPR repeat protein
MLKAAERGQSPAMVSVGGMLYGGEGVAMDKALAFVWWHRAATLGGATAMHNVAMMLEHGAGMRADQV